MAKKYQHRAQTEIISGGYVGEETGVIPVDSTWHTTTDTTGSATHTYYYRDSNSGENANSSRVDVTIRDDWSVSIDNRNYMTVTVKSYITSITRGSIIGNPCRTYSSTRHIRIYREAGGAVLAEFTNDPINTYHTISGSTITLAEYNFTLAPGEEASRGTVYFSNYTTGYEHFPPPTPYADIMWVGMSFKNILPKDYRPGRVRANDGRWYSHNRDAGRADVYTGSGMQEMRTISGAEASDNPPFQRHPSGYKNMRQIGIDS